MILDTLGTIYVADADLSSERIDALVASGDLREVRYAALVVGDLGSVDQLRALAPLLGDAVRVVAEAS